VTVAAPQAGDTVGGSSVPIVVDFNATGVCTSGITTLRFYVDDNQVSKKEFKQYGLWYPVREGRYVFTWNSTLYSNAAHTVKVQATDEANNSTTTANISVTVDNTGNYPPDRAVLADPSNVTDTSLNLAWTENGNSDFAKYEVHKSTTSGFTPGAGTLVATITDASQSSYHVSSLTANTTYYFKLKTYDDANPAFSVVSNQVSATTRTTGNDLPETTIISYSYDDLGRKTAMMDPRGTTWYSYNAAGRLTHVKDPHSYTVSYEYNKVGQRTKMTDQFSGETSYSYNAGGLLTKVTDPDGNETEFTYNAAGQRTRQDNENVTYTLYTYTSRGWADTITHKKCDNSTFLSFDYTYDKVGNRTKVEEHDGDYVAYSYDALYRLTRETRKDNQETVEYDYSYTYDAVGNRTKKTDEQTQDETDYTYNNMNQMTAAGNISYSWDNAGNMATKVVNQQTTTYTWDFRNKLLNVDFPEGDDVSLRYDGDGNRYKKVAGSTTTKFLFDTNLSLSALLFELDGSDTVQAKYRREGHGLLLAMKRGGALYTYHFDALGSTRALTNASETTTDTYEYDAWGNVTGSTGNTTNSCKAFGAVLYEDPQVEGGAHLLGRREADDYDDFWRRWDEYDYWLRVNLETCLCWAKGQRAECFESCVEDDRLWYELCYGVCLVGCHLSGAGVLLCGLLCATVCTVGGKVGHDVCTNRCWDAYGKRQDACYRRAYFRQDHRREWLEQWTIVPHAPGF